MKLHSFVVFEGQEEGKESEFAPEVLVGYHTVA